MKAQNIPQLKKKPKQKPNKNSHVIQKIYPSIYKTEPKPEKIQSCKWSTLNSRE